MSKSTLTIDTPKGCVFCPIAKMVGYNGTQEATGDRQPSMGISCPFCNGVRFIYALADTETLTYKNKDCPLKVRKEGEEDEEETI